jgi:hypothetical protein
MKGLLLPGLLAAFVACAGCAENDVSVSIVEIEALLKQNMCVATSVMVGTQLPAISRGTLDIDLDRQLNINYGYIAYPVVRNNLTNHPVGPAPNQVEINGMDVTGANVTISLPAGVPAPAGVPLSYFYPSAAGHLDPQQTAPMFLEVVPQALAVGLAGQIPTGGRLTLLARIRPVVIKQNNQIVGGPVDFPVDLCNGCLETFFTPPTCPYPTGATINTGGCIPQQDQSISCCKLSSGALHCGA